jgi:hypothetical protein
VRVAGEARALHTSPRTISVRGLWRQQPSAGG